MPSGRELDAEQKRRLLMLLRIKKDLDRDASKAMGTLDVLIMETKTEMEQEAVAYVEKMAEPY